MGLDGPPSPDRPCDVAVIGGGLVGCAAAHHLARAGASVVLLERGELNREASGRNAGSLHFQLERRMVEHGEGVARQYALSIPLHLDAQRTWAGLGQELGADLEIVQEGGLMLAETATEVALLEPKHELERAGGLATEVITGDEARRIAPYLSRTVLAAGYCATEGHANPRLVAPAYARAAARHGARIWTGCRVVAMGRRHGRWELAVSSERGGAGAPAVVADAVLVAAGAWSGDVAAMANVRLPIVPSALSMMATERTPRLVGHLVQHVGRRLSMKQVRDGNVLIGGGWPSALAQRGAGFDKDAPPALLYESMAANVATACEVVPGVGRLRIVRAWTGIVGNPADRLPVLGEVRRRPGLFVAAWSNAFTLGPTFARMVGDLILGGRSAPALELYGPARFDSLDPA
jgi:glycine/D-amino acid oxidase-like deaminating enzyme